MARGPKKHLKRINAPSHWMLDKLSGIYAFLPSFRTPQVEGMSLLSTYPQKQTQVRSHRERSQYDHERQGGSY